MTEPEKPKSGGRWGDLIALAVGTGVATYFTKIRGNPKYAGPSSETWLDAALVVVPMLLALGMVAYFAYRLAGVIEHWLRRRWAGLR